MADPQTLLNCRVQSTSVGASAGCTAEVGSKNWRFPTGVCTGVGESSSRFRLAWRGACRRPATLSSAVVSPVSVNGRGVVTSSLILVGSGSFASAVGGTVVGAGEERTGGSPAGGRANGGATGLGGETTSEARGVLRGRPAFRLGGVAVGCSGARTGDAFFCSSCAFFGSWCGAFFDSGCGAFCGSSCGAGMGGAVKGEAVAGSTAG